MEVLMSHWVIYRHPSDYPDKFVLRRHDIFPNATYAPSSEFYLADSLEEVRQYIPPDMTRMSRWPGDEPCIVETWI